MSLSVVLFPVSIPRLVSTAGAIPYFARTVPGVELGVSRSRWIAPYVRELIEGVTGPNDTCCCGPGVATVRWYTRDGDVERDVSGPGVQTYSGYVTSHSDSGEVFHGVEPFWTLSGLRRGVYSGTIGSSLSGRVLVHLLYPDSDHVSVDIYKDGVLERTIGPVASGRGHLGGQLNVDPSGAFVLVSSSSRARPRIQVPADFSADGVIRVPAPSVSQPPDTATVIVVNDKGRETFRFRTSNVRSYRATPDGSRVVFQENDELPPKPRREGGNTLATLDSTGNQVSLGAFPSSMVFWGPDAASLVAERYHDGASWFSRVDCRNGEILWEIPRSRQGSVNSLSMETLGDRLLICVSQDGLARIQAIEWNSGKTLGIWRASEASENARLMSVGGRVYFVTDEYFSEIDPSTIGKPGHDWESE